MGVREVVCARIAPAHRSMWCGKRKEERVKDKEPLIPVWPHAHPQCEQHKGKKLAEFRDGAKSGELVHQLHQETQTDKKKANIQCLGHCDL